MNTNNTKAQAADALFLELTKGYPAPWSLEFHNEDYHTRGRRLVSGISDASGRNVIYIETHTGDGDRFNLGDEGAKALVRFVNVMNCEK